MREARCLFSGGRSPPAQQNGDWFVFQSTMHSNLAVGSRATGRQSADLDEPRGDAAKPSPASASSSNSNRACRSSACAACSPASRCRCCCWDWSAPGSSRASCRRPIAALVKSADRIGEGDYTRPLAVVRHDELGDLQFALERMRQKLNETTITKNYLNTVLNSLSDAVLGDLARRHRQELQRGHAAAARLSEDEDLVGKPLIELHRRGASAVPSISTHSAPEARETVLRTASGQTIPVSMASSAITTRRSAVSGQHLRRAQHHRAQARRAAHPLSGALRHAHEDAESHAVPASAAAGHRTRAAQSTLAGAALSGSRPLQGSQRHLRPCRGRPHPGDPQRAADPQPEQGHGDRPAGGRRVRHVHR